MYVFELPEVGEGVVEAEIVRWLVAEGDSVSRDQRICEVMTDKATIEISSPVGGTVAKLYGNPGDVVKVHSPLVDFSDGGNGVAAPAKAEAPKAPKAEAPKAEAPKAPKAAAPSPAPASAPVARAPGEKTLASPAVRSYARENDVDLTAVPGSGKGGRVTRADVDAVSQAPEPRALPPEPRALPAVQVPSWAGAASGQDQVVKIIGLRRKIAEKMVQSYINKPHFTYVDEVDATELVKAREAILPAAACYGLKPTYIPFIMKALCLVFREFPTVNSTLDEATMEMTIHGSVNIGVATDTPQGLYVPVIRNVERKSILELTAELTSVTERVRTGQAGVADLTGGTFTITSVGNIGGRFATPIINAPECAILGVNQIHDRPVVLDGQIVARKMMYLSPSFDHRVLDGAVAARFVSALKDVLENPARLLLELR